jgi:hypothetical protein
MSQLDMEYIGSDDLVDKEPERKRQRIMDEFDQQLMLQDVPEFQDTFPVESEGNQESVQLQQSSQHKVMDEFDQQLMLLDVPEFTNPPQLSFQKPTPPQQPVVKPIQSALQPIQKPILPLLPQIHQKLIQTAPVLMPPYQSMQQPVVRTKESLQSEIDQIEIKRKDVMEILERNRKLKETEWDRKSFIKDLQGLNMQKDDLMKQLHLLSTPNNYSIRHQPLSHTYPPHMMNLPQSHLPPPHFQPFPYPIQKPIQPLFHTPPQYLSHQQQHLPHHYPQQFPQPQQLQLHQQHQFPPQTQPQLLPIQQPIQPVQPVQRVVQPVQLPVQPVQPLPVQPPALPALPVQPVQPVQSVQPQSVQQLAQPQTQQQPQLLQTQYPTLQIQQEQHHLLMIQQEQVRRQQEQQVLTQQLEQKTLQHKIFAEKQKAQALELEKILNPQAFQPPSDPFKVKTELAYGSDLPPNLQFLAKVLGPEAFEESKRKALALANTYKKDSANKEAQSKIVQSNLRSSLDRNNEYKDKSSEHKDKSSHKKHNSEGTKSLTEKQKHFRTLVADEIVKIVGKYRKKGELANKEAFKNQCRTFTLKVVESEIKNDGDLTITEKIITRMNTMVDKFFLKHGVANKKT